MSLKRFSFLQCLIVFIFAFSVQTADDSKIKAQWLKGFEIFEKAEELERSGNTEKAIKTYSEALSLFSEIRDKYPDWNPAFIKYRIGICENKIKTLKESLFVSEQKKADKTGQQPAKGGAIQDSAELKLLKQELKETKEKLDNAIEYISRMQKELERGKKAIEEYRELAKEKTETEKRYILLTEELKKIKAEIAATPSVKEAQDKIDKLSSSLLAEQSFNAKLQAENNELNSKIQNLLSTKTEDEFKLNKLKEECAKNQDLISESEKKVAEFAEKLGKAENREKELNEEIAKLKSKIEDEKLNSAKYADKIREITEKSGSVEALINSENEVLKKELELANQKIEEHIRQNKSLSAIITEKDTRIAKVEELLSNATLQSKELKTNLDKTTEKLNETLKRNQILEKTFNELETRNQKLEEEIKAISKKYEELSKKDKNFSELAKYCLELEERNRKHAETIDKLREEAENAKQELQKFKSESKSYENINAEVATLTQTNKKLEEEKEQLLKDIHRFSNLQDELNEAKKKNASIFQEYNSKIETLEATIARLNNELAKEKSLSEKLSAQNINHEALSEKLQNAEKKREEAEVALKKAEERISAMQSTTQEITELNKKLDESEKKLAILEDTLAKAKQNISDLTSKNSELERTLSETKTKLEVSEKNLKEILNSREKENEKAVNTEEILTSLKSENKKLQETLSLTEEKFQKTDSNLQETIKQNSELQNEIKKLNTALEEAKSTINVLKTGVVTEDVSSKPEQKGFSSEELQILYSAAQKSASDGKKESELWHYEKILSKNPSETLALRGACRACFELGKHDDALKYAERYLALVQDDADIRSLCAYIYAAKGQYLEALSASAKALSIRPQDPDLMRLAGIVCSNLDWNDAAEKNLRKSFELKANPDTAFNLAVLLATKEPRRLDEAEAFYKKSIELGGKPDPGFEELFKK